MFLSLVIIEELENAITPSIVKWDGWVFWVVHHELFTDFKSIYSFFWTNLWQALAIVPMATNLLVLVAAVACVSSSGEPIPQPQCPPLVSKNNTRVALNQQYDGAVSWCKFHSRSPRAAIRTGRWPLVTRSTLQRRLQGQKLKEDRRALMTNEQTEPAMEERPSHLVQLQRVHCTRSISESTFFMGFINETLSSVKNIRGKKTRQVMTP